MPRTKSVLLRLTEEEHSRLKELAGREPVSAYLRRVAIERHFKDVDRDAKTAEKFKEFRDLPPQPQPNVARRDSCKCPVSSCDYRAGSLAARCPRHGRLVVPA